MSDGQFTFFDDDGGNALSAAWDRALERLADEVPGTAHKKFLQPLRPISAKDGEVHLAAPGNFVGEWVKDRYIDRIASALGDEIGQSVIVKLSIEAREKPKPAASGFVPVTASSTYEDAQSRENKFRPNTSFTFESFVVGQSNRLAYGGAMAVAASPGMKYNPLFVYGPSGLGKTHLLHAIANKITARDPLFPLMYVSGQQFAEQFVSALQNHRIDEFRRRFRSVSVWLLDDVQFIMGKDKTQEEVFHTFNELHAEGKQIVLCADRAPRDLLQMDERLRSRLECGLVADVQMPDTETRCAIIQMKADTEHISLPHEVAMFLAESVPGNIRTLQGALNKIVAEASFSGSALTVDLARDTVDKYYSAMAMPKPGFEDIVSVVSRHYRIPKDDIMGTSRKAPIAHARHVSVFLVREITGDSWKHIGMLFGGRDHSSMMHAHNKVRGMANHDREFANTIHALRREAWPEAQ
ncbi:MAG TPA: chromosomal replication initiator protein DnaA [Fimbriimonadaceae bacterium]|nr:chromosomal replication initiator protein DnaA [Fimbriimonadaceae bacterium]